MEDPTHHVTNAVHAVARVAEKLEQRYASPSAPRTADDVTAGHAAVHEIDAALRHLYAARQALVGEMRADADETAARVDKMINRNQEAGQS